MSFIKESFNELIQSIRDKLENKETRFAQLLEWFFHPVAIVMYSSLMFFILQPNIEIIVINWNVIIMFGFLGIVSITSFFLLITLLPRMEELEGEQVGLKKLYKFALERGERMDLASGMTGAIDMLIFFTAVFIFKYPIPEVYIFACAILTAMMGFLGLIRFFWRISVHCAISSTVITAFTLLQFWYFVWLYALMIPIIYSRIKLEKHDEKQVTAGTLIGILLPVGLYFFVYLNPPLLALIQSLYT